MTINAIRSVVAAVALNPMETSEAIVRQAAHIAQRAGAELHLVHAVPGPRQQPFRPAATAALRAALRAAEDGFDALEAQLPAGAAIASRHIAADAPARVIVERAAELEADLIVLSTQRGPDLRGHFIGTTADRVLRTSTAPCWLVRDSVALPLRRIGVTTDFSPCARRALVQVLQWADLLIDREDRAARIELIHREWSVVVLDDPTIIDRVLIPRMHEEIALARTDVAGVDDIEIVPRVIEGVDAGRCIAEFAAAEGVEFLVVATHGHGAVRRALIGSVASSLARQAPCSVLCVPPAGDMD